MNFMLFFFIFSVHQIFRAQLTCKAGCFSGVFLDPKAAQQLKHFPSLNENQWQLHILVLQNDLLAFCAKIHLRACLLRTAGCELAVRRRDCPGGGKGLAQCRSFPPPSTSGHFAAHQGISGQFPVLSPEHDRTSSAME